VHGDVQTVVMTSLVADDGEQLTSGWEPALDGSDSVVRGCVLVHASWAVTQARSLGRPWRDEPEWAAGHAGERGAFSNQAVVKQPLLDLARVIAEVDELFPRSVPYLLVSPWPTGDLRALGLGLVGHPPLMYRPWRPQTESSSDLDLRWVATEPDLADAERVLVDGYPMPELQPFAPGCLYAPALCDGSTRIVVAYDRDLPVATAAAHSAHGITLIENVAVDPGARGKGAGAAVTEAATTAFADQPAALLASDDGQPVYERLGYLRIERWTVWLRTI
jgi:GNAT superfamily N-acetyltransferase